MRLLEVSTVSAPLSSSIGSSAEGCVRIEPAQGEVGYACPCTICSDVKRFMSNALLSLSHPAAAVSRINLAQSSPPPPRMAARGKNVKSAPSSVPIQIKLEPCITGGRLKFPQHVPLMRWGDEDFGKLSTRSSWLHQVICGQWRSDEVLYGIRATIAAARRSLAAQLPRKRARVNGRALKCTEAAKHGIRAGLEADSSCDEVCDAPEEQVDSSAVKDGVFLFEGMKFLKRHKTMYFSTACVSKLIDHVKSNMRGAQPALARSSQADAPLPGVTFNHTNRTFRVVFRDKHGTLQFTQKGLTVSVPRGTSPDSAAKLRADKFDKAGQMFQRLHHEGHDGDQPQVADAANVRGHVDDHPSSIVDPDGGSSSGSTV